jgi:hypothetical protein
MPEPTLQLIAFLKLIVVAVCGLLYGLGGMSGKWKRRYVGPVLYGLAIWGFTTWTSTFNALSLLSPVLLCAALHLGYGGSSTAEKIKKRAIAGSAAGCAGIPLFIAFGAPTLLFLHIAVCVGISVVAGVWNQTSSARTEETLIGAMYVLIPLLTI